MVATSDSGTALTRNAELPCVGQRSHVVTGVEHRKGVGRHYSNSSPLTRLLVHPIPPPCMAAKGAISSWANHANEFGLLPHDIEEGL